MILHIQNTEKKTWCGKRWPTLGFIVPPGPVPGDDYVCLRCLKFVAIAADKSKAEFDRRHLYYTRDSHRKIALEKLSL